MVLYLKSVADILVIRKIRQAQQEVPFFTFQKICFAYLNNDWIMVITSVMTLTAAMIAVIVENPLQFLRSQS
jgi:hypothetical protein